MKYAKQHVLTIALVISLMAISAMGTYIVMGERTSKVQPIPANVTTIIPTIESTIIPSSEPTAVPVKKTNPAIQTRLKELDFEITILQDKKTKLQDLLKKAAEPIDFSDRPAGYNPMIDVNNQIQTMESIRYDIRQIENQINTLNAERTQLLINQ